MLIRVWTWLVVFLVVGLIETTTIEAQSVRFEVKIASERVGQPPDGGRLVVAIVPKGQGEPRYRINDTDPPVPPLLGVDVLGFSAEKAVILDAGSDQFPVGGLEALPDGDYVAQAVFLKNRDINLASAPGNLYSKPLVWKHVGQAKADSVHRLTLTEIIADDHPKDTASVKYLKFSSKLLSDFHQRPMVYRVGVVLPTGFEQDINQKYLLRVHIGGFGTRYQSAARMRRDARFVQIVLDGAGPYGDPYQVDSANNGPYGRALTEELIPHIEKTFRCWGTPETRFLDGASTGGWVSFALQVFYPDFFNGCWSQCPDSVDFHRFELVNIYDDNNAFVDKSGAERPSKRDTDGNVIFTLRHELQVENVLGLGGRWHLGGRDWASWNSVYGPRGDDGLPKPLWNGKTGSIDRSVLDHWKKYDLCHILESNWPTLAPKLQDKIHIWVGDMDDYFLNEAVHRLKKAMDKQTHPPFKGVIEIAPGLGHTNGWNTTRVLNEMAKRGPKQP